MANDWLDITCPSPDTSGVCSIVSGVALGLGTLVAVMAHSLPALIIILAMVAIVIGVGASIAVVIKKSVTRHA